MDKLIIVISQNRNLGIIPSAHFIEDIETTTSLLIRDKVDTAHPEKYNYKFSESEYEVISILNKITDKHLFTSFSKEHSIKEFYAKLDSDKLEKIIRPYIDKQMMKCFNILATNEDIHVYFKDNKYNNIYKDDKIKIHTKAAEPVFYFTLDENGIIYSLKIIVNDDELTLSKNKPVVITSQPCSLLIRKNIYFFKNTNSKKFLPFFNKNFTQIKPHSVDTYMRTFVANTVKEHIVINKGFSIVNNITKPKVSLNLSHNLQQEPILTLEYTYGSKTYLAYSPVSVSVELSKSDDEYKFIKYKRNETWENNIIGHLEQLGLLNIEGPVFYPEGSKKYFSLYPIIDWYNKNKTALDKLDILLKQQDLKKEYYLGEATCEMNTTDNNDWYDLQMLVKAGEFEIPFLKFRTYIISGKKEYELPDGKLFIIPQEWFNRYSNILIHANKSNGKLQLKRVFKHLIKKSDSEKYKIQTPVYNSAVPQKLNATLRPYQQQGYSWMNNLYRNNYGGILADDMGLGKTLQTITLLLHIYDNETKNNIITKPVEGELFPSVIEGFNTSNIGASLIIMPVSLIHNWLNEFKKFAPKLKIYTYTGNKRLKSKEIGNIFKHYHVVLSSYGVIRNDIEFLKHYTFHYFILDESQYIKNPISKTYQAITQIECENKLVLTGTPIENSLIDLWAQMNFVNDELLGSLNFFKQHFANPISKFNNEKLKEELQELIEPFILRRTKDKVAKELPPMTEQILLCDMTPDQKIIYDKEKSGIRNQLLKIFASEDTKRSTFIALQGLTLLRQIANHPKLTDSNYTGYSGKYNLIFNHLNNIIEGNHKVLIFSSFVKDLSLIENNLIDRKIEYSKLTGSTTKRQEAVNKFENDVNCKVFLISLKAGGVGLNLTSADYVFLLNPWWNPAAESQAVNRAHRIGQTKNVFIYKFISVGTIEEKIMELQKHKSELANTFINSNNPFKNMNQQDITELFS